MKSRTLIVLLLGLLVTAAGAQTPQQYVTGVNWECSLADTPELGLLGAASVASAGGNIYILQGNTLRKLSSDLRELASVQLPDLMQALQMVQVCRQDLSCGMNGDTTLAIPADTTHVLAGPVQCAAQDMVQGLHEAHTLRTLATAQLSADAFGVYVLRGGRLTVYDTSLRELRNTPIVGALTASSGSCPVCASMTTNGALMDQIRYRGMLQGVGPSVVSTVGYSQPVSDFGNPNTAWSDVIGSTYGPYSGGVPLGYTRVTPGTTGTPLAGTAVSPVIVRSGYGYPVRTTPGTTGTPLAGTAVMPGITRVYGGGPYGVGAPVVGTNSWGVTPGGVFGAPGTYGAPPATAVPPGAPPPPAGGGGVLTPGSYRDFSEVQGDMIADDDALAQAKGGFGMPSTAGARGRSLGTSMVPGVTTNTGFSTGTGAGTTGDATGTGMVPGTSSGFTTAKTLRSNTGLNTGVPVGNPALNPAGLNTQLNTGMGPGASYNVNAAFGAMANPGAASATGTAKAGGYGATTATGFQSSMLGRQSATSPSGRAMQSMNVTGGVAGAVLTTPNLPTVTSGPFTTNSFAGPGTASSTGRPSVWGTQFGNTAGVGVSTGFGTSSGIGLGQGNAQISPVTPSGTTSLLTTIMNPGVGVQILSGTTATVTTTAGTADTSVGRIPVPANSAVMPGGLVVLPNGIVLGLIGPVASNLPQGVNNVVTEGTGRRLIPGTSNVVTIQNGSVIGPNGTLALPAGSVITRNGTIIRTDGTLILPTGAVATPNTSAAGLGALFGGGFGTVAQPGYQVSGAFGQTGPSAPQAHAPTGGFLPPDVTYIPAQPAPPSEPPVGYGTMLSTYGQVPTAWNGTVGPVQTGMGFVPGQPNLPLPPVETPVVYTAPVETPAPPPTLVVEVPTAMAPQPLPTPAPMPVATQPSSARTLGACANRVAWMYETPLTPGHVMPIALRNVINGCVILGYAGDAEGPKRLHVRVLRSDNAPDMTAKVTTFIYPKNEVDAGVALSVKPHGAGEFYANFDPNICDGDMLAVRVKRPGMHEQVVYFSLAAPEMPGAVTAPTADVQSSVWEPMGQTGIVNPTYATSAGRSSVTAGMGGHGPRVETMTGMSTDACPECGQKLPSHSTAPIPSNGNSAMSSGGSGLQDSHMFH